jgi:hypothetical protein
MKWYGLVNRFIDHLYTRLGITSNLQNSQITTAPANPIFQPAVSSIAVPYQRFLTLEILQLPALMSLLLGEYPATELLSTVKSTAALSLLSLPCRARRNCQPSTHWVPGWRSFHTNLIAFSSQTDFQLTTVSPQLSFL